MDYNGLTILHCEQREIEALLQIDSYTVELLAVDQKNSTFIETSYVFLLMQEIHQLLAFNGWLEHLWNAPGTGIKCVRCGGVEVGGGGVAGLRTVKHGYWREE